jgi:uncharacterized protein (TIGR02300 family)
MQDKSKLGNRFTCYGCGKKFYDLNRDEPVCPGCGANQLEDPTPDPRVAVMERYKGSRLTAEDTAPSKAAFTVEDTESVDTEGADAADAAEGAEGAEAAEFEEPADTDDEDLEAGPVLEPEEKPST